MTHVIEEKRGKNEGSDFEFFDGANYNRVKLDVEIAFADGKSNSAGLQLADLVARPIGSSALRPG